MGVADLIRNDTYNALRRYGLYTKAGLPLLSAYLQVHQTYGNIPDITGTTVEGIFHYHPDGSKPSPEDYTSGLTWSKLAGISYSIVYSKDRIYKRWF